MACYLSFLSGWERQVVIKNIDIARAMESAQRALEEDQNMADSTRRVFELLLVCLSLLIDKFGANSKNSGTPPSQDPNRTKKTGRKSVRRVGGQKGHVGATLSQVSEPDHIVEIGVDRRTLPKGGSFACGPVERRQVFDVHLSVEVTEYRAEVLFDSDGRKYTAEFPKGVVAPVQYGSSVKGLALYLSCYQMLPFERLEDFFRGQFSLPISKATLCNIRSGVSEALERFRKAAVTALLRSDLLFGDETGINVAGQNRWLHCVSSLEWTLLTPHEKRGKQAPDEVGVLPHFDGVLIHDNWSSYFQYENVTHALCNAHQIRELTRLEENGVRWATKMKTFLLELNEEVTKAGGELTPRKQKNRRLSYREILKAAGRETPKPEPPKNTTKGRQKKSRARNLLERLVSREEETLLFMSRLEVPFTNNQGERDQRMTKVKMKVSGTYKTLESATQDALLRSFISTCRKQGIGVGQALSDLAAGNFPEFVTKELTDT